MNTPTSKAMFGVMIFIFIVAIFSGHWHESSPKVDEKKQVVEIEKDSSKITKGSILLFKSGKIGVVTNYPGPDSNVLFCEHIGMGFASASYDQLNNLLAEVIVNKKNPKYYEFAAKFLEGKAALE